MKLTDSQPLRPGQPAPDFSLPALHRDGTVSLGDYRGRNPVLLALFRGVYCPFCRRAIAQLGLARDRLLAAGVESLAVVATKPERARLYFRYRPARVPIAADPELVVHEAFGVPRIQATPGIMEELRTVRIDVGGELSQPLSIPDAANALDEKDRFEHTPVDNEEMERQFGQLCGVFLVDRAGIVRWASVECVEDGLAGLGKFPAEEELLAAARAHGG